jgi:hypothetical protein
MDNKPVAKNIKFFAQVHMGFNPDFRSLVEKKYNKYGYKGFFQCSEFKKRKPAKIQAFLKISELNYWIFLASMLKVA